VYDRHWSGWIAIVWVIAVSWLTVDAQNAPAALPVNAPTDLFSAGRAHQYVEAIACAPHPMGSPESERVREILVERLEELGLNPEIQASRREASSARNVLARLKGKGPPGKKALMLCAHSDSVPSGPGAGDDAAGVAVVLETLRAIQAGVPLQRDLIVLFDDGEENGFHGSRLFVDEHPWAKEIGLVLNFDARGNSGPSIMFETSEDNGWLIRQYAQAIPQPLATSLSMDVYRIMPNDTDLTVFKQAGMGGLNFAFGAGLAYYHTADDTPENLDPRTLQHQGENALAAVRRFGQLDLEHTREENVVYTTILSRMVVSYSTKWVRPLAFVTSALFVALVVISLYSKRMQLADLAAGAGVIFTAMCVSLLAVGILFFLGIAWSALCDALNGTSIPWLKFDVPIMTGCALLTMVVTLIFARWSGSRRPLVALSLGAFSWWLVLTLVTAVWLPGASYLFVWPTLCGLVGVGMSIWLRPGSAFAWFTTLLCSLPSLVLLPPLFRATFDGLSLGMTAPIMIVVVLFAGTLVPLGGSWIAPDVNHWREAVSRVQSAQPQLTIEDT
jgi:Peptidase family M28